MRRIIPFQDIRGKVLYNSYDSSKATSSLQPLGNVKVTIFQMEEITSNPALSKGSDVLIRRKPLAAVFTNSMGEFSFRVYQGVYSIAVVKESLPPGKGVLEASMIAEAGINREYIFEVRDVHSIELPIKSNSLVHPGSTVMLCPILKDNSGNPLHAKATFSTDSSDVRIDDDRLSFHLSASNQINLSLKVSSGSVTESFPLTYTILKTQTDEQIRLAYSHGAIDEKQKIHLYLQTLFQKDSLESRYSPSEPIKSGTTMIKEIQDYIRKTRHGDPLAESARQQLSTSLPKLDKFYTSPSGYFRIHYTTEGSNAVENINLDDSQVPEYIRFIGSCFDHSKAYTCGLRGFRTPVLDKGASCFDIYVYDLKGVYGITVGLKQYNTRYNAPTASCYIAVDNSYSKEKGFKKSREDCLKVTAAHEFFHAVQYAYNLEADRWWKEASATWNEDEVYTGVNDYVQYLNSVFSHPEKPLEEYSYGGVLFAKLLSENYGGYRIMKRIWELQSTSYQKSISAISAAISEAKSGEDIGTAFDRFTAYNFNPVQYYKEGHLWDYSLAVINTYSSFPVASVNGRLNHLSSNYQLFKLTEAHSEKSLKIIIDGTDNSRVGLKLQKRRISDNLCDISDISSVSMNNRAEIIIKNPSRVYKEICLIPANLERNKDNISYTFSAVLQ